MIHKVRGISFVRCISYYHSSGCTCPKIPIYDQLVKGSLLENEYEILFMYLLSRTKRCDASFRQQTCGLIIQSKEHAQILCVLRLSLGSSIFSERLSGIPVNIFTFSPQDSQDISGRRKYRANRSSLSARVPRGFWVDLSLGLQFMRYTSLTSRNTS